MGYWLYLNESRADIVEYKQPITDHDDRSLAQCIDVALTGILEFIQFQSGLEAAHHSGRS